MKLPNIKILSKIKGISLGRIRDRIRQAIFAFFRIPEGIRGRRRLFILNTLLVGSVTAVLFGIFLIDHEIKYIRNQIYKQIDMNLNLMVSMGSDAIIKHDEPVLESITDFVGDYSAHFVQVHIEDEKGNVLSLWKRKGFSEGELQASTQFIRNLQIGSQYFGRVVAWIDIGGYDKELFHHRVLFQGAILALCITLSGFAIFLSKKTYRENIRLSERVEEAQKEIESLEILLSQTPEPAPVPVPPPPSPVPPASTPPAETKKVEPLPTETADAAVASETPPVTPTVPETPAVENPLSPVEGKEEISS